MLLLELKKEANFACSSECIFLRNIMKSKELTVTVTLLLACVWQGASVRTRTYYLAAVEEDWDYAPQGNLVSNVNA
jgi:hypothetical protein